MLKKQVFRFFTVCCDDCGKKSTPITSPADALRLAREEAWARIWTYTGWLDLCPACKRTYSMRSELSLEELLRDA